MTEFTCPIWNVPITHGNPSFDFKDDSWKTFYAENGYAVIEGVISGSDRDRLEDLFLTDLENMVTDGIDRNNPKTFTKANRPGICSVGIIKDYKSGFAHSRTAYTARKLSRPVFQSIYGTDDLQTSFDGGSVYPNWKFMPKEKTKGSWLHIDQGHHMKDISCTQALVTLLPADITTGSLLVAPKSHLRHSDILKELKSTKKNYIPLNKDIEEHKKIVQDCGLHLVTAKAGSIILWNSKVIHSNTCALVKPTSEKAYLRLAIYVCMTPSRKDENTLSIRKEVIDNQYQTNHWPFYPAIKKEQMVYPRHKSFPPLKSVALSREVIQKDFPEFF